MYAVSWGAACGCARCRILFLCMTSHSAMAAALKNCSHRSPKRTKVMVEEIKTAIQSGNRFFITSHVRLDGDALGSELALYLMLKGLGKQAVVCNQDPTPEQYRFLPAAEYIVHTVDNPEEYDVGVILDCSEAERVGSILPYLMEI